jgi:hypothetical protein
VTEVNITAKNEGTNTAVFSIQSSFDDNIQNNSYSITYHVQSSFDALSSKPNNPSSTVFSFDYTENLFIIDFKVTDEGIYVATPSGIQLYKDEVLIDTISYPKEWYSCYSELLSPLTRSMLEVNEDFIVINMAYTIYIMDRHTKKFVSRINTWDCDRLLAMRKNFDWVNAMKIQDSLLYVTDSYYLNIFDLNTGCQLCREYFPNTASITMYDSYILSADRGDISVFNMENHQLKIVEVSSRINNCLHQVGENKAYILKSSNDKLSTLSHCFFQYSS